jgi:hypothetical protein
VSSFYLRDITILDTSINQSSIRSHIGPPHSYTEIDDSKNNGTLLQQMKQVYYSINIVHYYLNLIVLVMCE